MDGIDHQTNIPWTLRLRYAQKGIVYAWPVHDGRYLRCGVTVIGGHWTLTLSYS